MNKRFVLKLAAIVAISMLPPMCLGQQVEVSPGKGSVVLSVRAQRPYQLTQGETRTPVLSVVCSLKGKTTGHLLKFSPGGTLAQDNPDASSTRGPLTMSMTVGGVKQATTWMPYGDTTSFAYLGRTEFERVQFIQSLLNSATVSIEFKPFLTGVPTTSVFDVSQLRGEMDKHRECAMQ